MSHNITKGHICVYPSDGTGCGMYRMAWPGNAVKKSGKTVNVLQRPARIAVDQSNKIRGIDVGTAEVVVFQRPGSYQIAEVIPLLQDQGRKVVIDMDDSLSKIHPRNPAWRVYDPRVNHKTNWMHAAKACSLADLVTVTTDALANEYGQHGRVIIIPNHVPKSYLDISKPVNKTPIIGWAGYTATHVDDLRVTKGAINKVVSETQSRFAGFGDRNIFTELGIKLVSPHESWGFTNINEYAKRLVRFDIGLVPLKTSDFNRAKSWLKGLEYASLGIVPVVTPIGDYLNLIDLGMAIPAETPDDWYRVVRELVEDHDMRREWSEKVRKLAANWTIEGNSFKWWDAWNSTSMV